MSLVMTYIYGQYDSTEAGRIDDARSVPETTDRVASRVRVPAGDR